MIPLNDRQILAQNIRQAQAAGACLHAAWALAGIDSRTLQRWGRDSGLMQGDRRLQAMRKTPLHALSAAERARILDVANASRRLCAFASPALAHSAWTPYHRSLECTRNASHTRSAAILELSASPL